MKKISLILLICCFPLFITSCEKKLQKAEVGRPAPDFTLTDLRGKTWTLSELKGQVVFVNFWSTWCPPCRREMPSMQRLYAMMPKNSFKMLAILSRDDPFQADSFAAKHGITMPILNDRSNAVGPRYGITGIPETFIIGKEGILLDKFIGPDEWDSPANTEMMMKYINQ